jgi:flagellar biogenesis protein FliO
MPLHALRAAVAGGPALPLVTDVDPVLVGIIAVLLFIVFLFFLLIRRTVKSFAEGIREGRRR